MLGGAIVGALSGSIVNNSSSFGSLIISTSALIIVGVVFILTLAFFTIRWVPYDK